MWVAMEVLLGSVLWQLISAQSEFRLFENDLLLSVGDGLPNQRSNAHM